MNVYRVIFADGTVKHVLAAEPGHIGIYYKNVAGVSNVAANVEILAAIVKPSAPSAPPELVLAAPISETDVLTDPEPVSKSKSKQG